MALNYWTTSHQPKRNISPSRSVERFYRLQSNKSYLTLSLNQNCLIERTPSNQFRENSDLPKIIAKSILSALALLKPEFNGIHTDINPNNVFLNLTEPSPVVKVGDLGNMLREGYKTIRLQCLPCRAPDVWRGLGCCYPSDAWSVGVTLAHWLSPYNIFGAQDKTIQGFTKAWCIAKIRRLVGPLDPPVNSDYEEEFWLGEQLESTTFVHPDTNLERPFIQVGTVHQELEKLPGPKISPELLDFIDYLLVVDHTKRPTALEALQHPYLQSLL
ncbi:MAG: hypothetical protein M1834_008984 [Cirrosporium novae-zelandiae]|nr:MAG: hypothetical protein M1834_008984 [Cirrosporium novae-zelandiae]